MNKNKKVVFVLYDGDKILAVYSEKKWKDGSVVKAFLFSQKINPKVKLESIGLDD